MKRIKRAQIPVVKRHLLEKQNYKCGLCTIDMSKAESRDLCLDHDHKSGHIRAVLCRNCNGIEGKIFNLANRGKRKRTPLCYLRRLTKYWEDYHPSKETDGTLFHPDHKTEDEQRLERNRKARLRNAKKQAAKNVGK